MYSSIIQTDELRCTAQEKHVYLLLSSNVFLEGFINSSHIVLPESEAEVVEAEE